MGEKDVSEISVKKFFLLLVKNWYIIAICFLVGVLGCYGFASLGIKPKYDSTAVFILNYTDESSSSSASNANSELTYSKNIVANCVAVISYNKFYDTLSAKLATDPALEGVNASKISGSALSKAIQYTTSANTSVITATITTNSAELSCKIAIVMQEVVGDFITSNYLLSSDQSIIVSPINTPVLATSPSSPNKTLYAVLGGLIALVVVIAVLLIIQRFDTRIKDEDELMKNYNLPILGVIPQFNLEEVTDVKEKG